MKTLGQVINELIEANSYEETNPLNNPVKIRVAKKHPVTETVLQVAYAPVYHIGCDGTLWINEKDLEWEYA